MSGFVCFSYRVQWRRDGREFDLPASVCLDGPGDSLERRLEALTLAVLEHNPADFPEEIEDAEFLGAVLEGVSG